MAESLVGLRALSPLAALVPPQSRPRCASHGCADVSSVVHPVLNTTMDCGGVYRGGGTVAGLASLNRKGGRGGGDDVCRSTSR